MEQGSSSGGRVRSDGESFDLSRVRTSVASAMATLDPGAVSQALADAIQELFRPTMMAGFTLEPEGSLELVRFQRDERWMSEVSVLPDSLDFTWLEPILGSGVPNGASVVGPDLVGATQMGAAMTTGDGRFAYAVIAGVYDDVELIHRRFADFARESGEAFAAILKANEHGADLAAVREREKLSRDLHDSLSQSLWSLSMLSETATAMIDPSDPLHDMIRQIADLSLTSQQEMRSMLINLRTVEPAQESLAGVLESVAADFRAANDVDVTVSIAEADVGPDVVAAFRRITEEALNNVSRHANASTVTILLDVEPVLCLRVFDDGAGFKTGPGVGHLGLRIMEERAAEVGCEFDIDALPGAGTVVTASRDLDRQAALPIRPGPQPAPSKRELVVPLLVAALSLMLALGAFALSRIGGADVDEAREELDALDVLDLRIGASRAAADELSVRLLQTAGLADGDEVIDAAVARELAKGAAIRATAATDPVDGAYLDLLLVEVPLIDWDTAPVTSDEATRADSIESLAHFDAAISFSLLEVIAARFALNPDAFEASVPMSELLLSVAGQVADVGGYLGPDEAMPLVDGYYSTEVVEVHESAAFDELNRIFVDEGLWVEDRWLRRWGVTNAAPPGPLPDYAERSVVASTASRALVDMRLADLQQETTGARDGAQQRRLVFGIAALALLVPASLGAYRAMRTARVRYELLAAAGKLDPVSGAKRRRAIESDIMPLLADPHLKHHALVRVDLDRFRFLNEVHGRELGDRMLDVVGAGLVAMARFSPAYEGVVVRSGDGEFIASFHSADPLPLELLRPALDRVRSTLVSCSDATFVRCSFSYGVSISHGSPDLESMLADAELDAYEDRSRLKV